MENFDFIGTLRVVAEIANSKGVFTILILSIVNAVIGMAAAVQAGAFDPRRMGDSFAKVAPYIIAYVAVLLLNNVAMEIAVFGAVVASQTSGILRNLALLFPTLASALPEVILDPASVARKRSN